MSAAPIVSRDCFRLFLDGDVLIVVLRNCDESPSINSHVLSALFDAMKQVVTDHGLTKSGWHVVYDFSAVTDYEITAAMAFPNFYRWARANGRSKAAHILPRQDDDNKVEIVKRMILGQVAPAGSDDNHYTANDRADALAWIAQMKSAGVEKDRP